MARKTPLIGCPCRATTACVLMLAGTTVFAAEPADNGETTPPAAAQHPQSRDAPSAAVQDQAAVLW